MRRIDRLREWLGAGSFALGVVAEGMTQLCAGALGARPRAPRRRRPAVAPSPSASPSVVIPVRRRPRRAGPGARPAPRRPRRRPSRSDDSSPRGS